MHSEKLKLSGNLPTHPTRCNAVRFVKLPIDSGISSVKSESPFLTNSRA
jgi:hypothetical protein